ncbi:hypothetical protein C8R44DRAFT_849608 [Mycena epipterygia]|nr:hypothetical protein C8R44DRAFT_849608 [Mycena epipterygia]
MSFNNTNDNTDFGRDTGRTGGGYDNNAGSTGFGSTQSGGDQFDPSTNLGGYGQDGNMSANNMNSSSMGYGQDSNMNSGMNSSMNSSSFGTSSRTDDLDSGVTGGGVMQGDQFGSTGRTTDFDNGNTGRSGKVPMGDKLKGGAEKLAGKVMGNSGMQERGQERKMGEFENNDF